MSKNQVHPCNQCSFRKDIEPGFLGGSPPETYIGQAEGPFMVPCHKLCDFSDPQWREKSFETGQCAGMAVYRANLGLTMPAPLHQLPPSDEVFKSHAEFLAHHKRIPLVDAVKELEATPPYKHLMRELQDPRVMTKEDPAKTHEQVVREALEAGKDPHTAWAAVMYSKPYEAVTTEERRAAKSLNFHLMYSTSFMRSVKWPKDITQHLG